MACVKMGRGTVRKEDLVEDIGHLLKCILKVHKYRGKEEIGEVDVE